MAQQTFYTDGFYDGQESGSSRSAALMVPRIVELLSPTSVIDIGCGVGPWLAEFAKAGVSDCYGVDGPWVNPGRFLLEQSRLIQYDFSKEQSPFRPKLPKAQFDLVVSFEFLEHVESGVGPALVAFLASLGDTIIISAALPGQGGTGHVNERWIDEWVAMFQPYGFAPFDFIRPLFWDNAGIEPWYRQNAFGLFRKPPPPAVIEAVQTAALERLKNPIRVVHPEIFELSRHRDPWKLPRELAKRIGAPQLKQHLQNVISGGKAR